MSKLKLWHTNAELKDYHGCSIVFLCKDGRHFHEASYFGYDYDNGEPRFQSNGLTIDNRDILLWCERKDLFYKTNLAELQNQNKNE